MSDIAVLARPPQPGGPDHPLAGQFRQFIGGATFPCVGAKSALGKDQLEIMVCRSITSTWDDLAISRRLLAFAHRYRRRPQLFQSFVVLFEGPRTLTEAQFETALWQRLQSLADKDRWHGQPHDPQVSPDPADPHFAMSFGGQGFFVVGLHPHASRPARRFRSPALVFNLHDQFRRLRAEGRYEKLRGAILARDEALAGSLNPMLSRHGEQSEARQYSGRVVDAGWRCPFHRP